MPLLDAAASEYSRFTESASTCIRALALGTIGVAWLFLDTGDDPSKALGLASHHVWLEVALAAAVLALIFDAIQYIVGAMLYQLLATTLEEVVEHPDHRPDPARNQQSWEHASDIGFVVHILRAVNPAAAPGARATQQDEAKDLIRDLHDESKSADSGVVKTREMLARPWAPRSYVGWTRRFFWLKSFAAAVGGVSVLVFCLLVIF